jgi:hypothetical protein
VSQRVMAVSSARTFGHLAPLAGRGENQSTATALAAAPPGRQPDPLLAVNMAQAAVTCKPEPLAPTVAAAVRVLRLARADTTASACARAPRPIAVAALISLAADLLRKF